MHIYVHIIYMIEIITDGRVCVSECITVWQITHWEGPRTILVSLPFHIFFYSLSFCFGERYCMGPEKAMAPHSSILAWKIPWMEEPGRLQFMGVSKSQTWLSDFTFTFHFDALEKEMATHSSVLAWRIPGTGESGRLPSLGSHRVGQDWSDLAAAAAAAALYGRPHRVYLVLIKTFVFFFNWFLCKNYETQNVIQLFFLKQWDCVGHGFLLTKKVNL